MTAQKLRRGLAACPRCGLARRVSTVAYCEQSVDCELVVVAARMRAAGFGRAGAAGPVLRRAGFEVRYAPVSATFVPWADAPEPWKSWELARWERNARLPRRQKLSMPKHVRIPQDGPWAAPDAVRAVGYFLNVDLSPLDRTWAVRSYVEDEQFRHELADTLAVTMRLGGREKLKGAREQVLREVLRGMRGAAFDAARTAKASA